jgi:hypothetical protein
MEVDVLQTLSESSSETWLAHDLKSLVVWNCTVLVQLSVKSLPDHVLARVLHVSVPVTEALALADAALTPLHEVWEVPGEVEHISVLVLVEL